MRESLRGFLLACLTLQANMKTNPGPPDGVAGHPCDRATGVREMTEAAIRKALKKGDSGIRKIAPILGVGTGTVQRIKAEMSAAV